MEFQTRLDQAASDLAQLLAARQIKTVFAESCTAGRIAAAVGAVPGISNYFCGSAVTYRLPTKTAWLDVSPATLEQFTAESQQTTDAMAQNVLRITPEADWALAITGHFGPDIENELDGRCFLSVVQRDSGMIHEKSIQLESTDRKIRQLEAACLAIEFLASEIQR